IDQSQSLEKKGNSVKLLAGVVVIMVIYAWLLDLTGFLLTSSVVMVSLFIIFGVRSFKKISLIMLIVLGLLYFSFEKLLYAPLPVGTLIEPFLG
ncbi:MAG: tripartite tricarboxylate transporter TctB family protein, partial [bacterium]